MGAHDDLIAEARKAQRLCNSSGEEYYAVQFNRLADALDSARDEYGKLEREVVRLRRENAKLRAQINSAPPTVAIGATTPGPGMIRQYLTEEAFQREAWRRGMH